MASIFQRRRQWWIKLRRRDTGEVIRESLETHDRARAELLREHLELQAALRDPRFKACAVPERVRRALGIESSPPEVAATLAVSAPLLMPGLTPAMKRTTVDEAVKAYIRFISAENAPPHVANKISMLRRFIGDDRVEKAGGPARPKPKKGKKVKRAAPFFRGEFLDEITTLLIQEFIEGLGLSRVSMRHYREFFSHFFTVCLRLDLYHPTNWHRPNPATGLPSYHTKNQRIAFLTDEQIQEQLDALKEHPDIRLAVATMIYAGLRRSETLWLTEKSIAADMTYLSVLNRFDQEVQMESTLKTGERTVTILPPLKMILMERQTNGSDGWLTVNSLGQRWRPDNFTRRLAAVNKKHGLKWTCLTYRHTFATQRASEGWSLFRIAKEMGNSAAIVEKYYAGFIRPSLAAAAA